MANFMNPPIQGGNPYDYINPQQGVPQQQKPVDPRAYDTPTITTNGGIRPKFTIKGSNEEKSMLIPVDTPVADAEKTKKPKKTRKKKTTSEDGQIIRANSNDVTVEESTSYTYMETTGMLRETLAQIDALNSELMVEFENVKHSRTMKNKYNTLIGISENVGSLLSNRIAAIREINNSITKSNDLDYKKLKDIRAQEGAMNDDKFVTELYQSFISQPQNVNMQQPTVPDINPSIVGSNIIRANIPNGQDGQIIDESYLNYMSNLTPQQNLMRYESDPNVKQVVVFDEKTGNKFFQWMNIATGEAITNVEAYDTELFMPDTVIDLKTNTAKNINLNEVFPVVVINKGVASQY